MQRRRAFSGLGECSRRAPRSRATGAALGTVSAARVAPSGFEPRTPASAAHFARLSKSRFICRLVPLASRPLESGAPSRRPLPWGRRGPWRGEGGTPARRSRARGGPIGPLLAKTTTPRRSKSGEPSARVFLDARRMRRRHPNVRRSADHSASRAAHSSPRGALAAQQNTRAHST